MACFVFQCVFDVSPMMKVGICGEVIPFGTKVCSVVFGACNGMVSTNFGGSLEDGEASKVFIIIVSFFA